MYSGVVTAEPNTRQHAYTLRNNNIINIIIIANESIEFARCRVNENVYFCSKHLVKAVKSQLINDRNWFKVIISFVFKLCGLIKSYLFFFFFEQNLYQMVNFFHPS